MPFIIGENPSAVVCTVEAVRDNPVRALIQRALEEQQVHIPEIVVGSTRYPLRRHLIGTYTRALRELSVQGVSPVITGSGETAQKAQQDFYLKVHAAFQHLLHRRPFEMDEYDKLVWNTLNDFIDVTVYRNATPLVVRQFGRISRVQPLSKDRPCPVEVRWEDGRREHVTVSDVDDPDYVTYRPGQPFEATVHRDPLTSRLIRVVSIRRCGQTHRLPAEDETRLLAETGASKQLEQDTEWQP